MLGIEITRNAIRIVQMRRRAGAWQWQKAVTIDIDDVAAHDVDAIAAVLEQTVRQYHWYDKPAVVVPYCPASFFRRIGGTDLGLSAPPPRPPPP